MASKRTLGKIIFMGASVVLLLVGCGQREPTVPTADEAFDSAAVEMTVAFFEHVPEAATTIGLDEAIVPGTSVRFMDRSTAGNKKRNEALEAALRSLQDVDPDLLSADRQRRHTLLTTLFDGALAPSRVVDYGTTAGDWSFWYSPYAIVQNSGPTIEIPRTLDSLQPVNTAAEARVYLERLANAADSLDGTLENFRTAVAQGAGPPDFIVQKSLAVVEAFARPAAPENAIYLSFRQKLDAAGVEGTDEFAKSALIMIENDVIPAYQRIASYLREILPSAPHEAGVWRLPNGDKLYQAAIYHFTDTHMSAEEIHELGLQEVHRITREMDAIFRAQGYEDGTVGERLQQLLVEPRFLYSNDSDGKAKLLADIQEDIDEMYTLLPQLFVKVPEAALEVRPLPVFSQDSAPDAYYSGPAPDGSRPGIYFINLRDPSDLPSWTMPTLNYHEAVPGHHLDSSAGLSEKRTPLESALYSNASAEGWGLYAEQLAAEVGVYDDDPYGDLGRLQAELYRAGRLVVDTGLHHKRWSREQAIDYMINVTGSTEASSITEVERYVALPGQALGYKLGQLTILELRNEAQQVLGDEFDMRQFNQQILEVAALPLPGIEKALRDWMVSQKQAP